MPEGPYPHVWPVGWHLPTLFQVCHGVRSLGPSCLCVLLLTVLRKNCMKCMGHCEAMLVPQYLD